MNREAGGSGADPPPDDGDGARGVDAQRVLASSGVLAEWNAAGLLAAADLHVTDRLVAMCGEPVSAHAQLGAALAVRAVRAGSTCLALSTVAPGAVGTTEEPAVQVPSTANLVAELKASPLVAGSPAGPLRPLVLMDSDDGPLLYLQKYFRQEQTIRDVLAARALGAPEVDAEALATGLDEVFGTPSGTDDEPDLQRLAVALAASRYTTVLAGGPGTGKTYTVARMLAVLELLDGPGLRVGLCAPTGRAAAQLQASVAAEATPSEGPTIAHTPPVRAVTVHSLLGWRPGFHPRFGRGNSLPHDVIVVDETSMLSMTAMSRLLEAVRPDARVVFVGDPHQLASVEAGAVLADLVERTGGPDGDTGPERAAMAVRAAGAGSWDAGPLGTERLADGVVTLRRGHRFGGDIAAVAAAINAGDADSVVALVESASAHDVELLAPDRLDPVVAAVTAWGEDLRIAARSDPARALEVLDSHRVLCAHREGPWGVAGWSRTVAEWIGVDDPDSLGWHPGQPILVTANDRQSATFNGDTGVVVADPSAPRSGAVQAVFRRGPDLRFLHPTQIAEVVPMYAMTIHRSQGSQFEEVTVVLPPAGSELLTRELLYTAITRARRRVRIIGTADVLRAAVGRRVRRASGLRSALTMFS